MVCSASPSSSSLPLPPPHPLRDPSPGPHLHLCGPSTGHHFHLSGPFLGLLLLLLLGLFGQQLRPSGLKPGLRLRRTVRAAVPRQILSSGTAEAGCLGQQLGALLLEPGGRCRRPARVAVVPRRILSSGTGASALRGAYGRGAGWLGPLLEDVAEARGDVVPAAGEGGALRRGAGLGLGGGGGRRV